MDDRAYLAQAFLERLRGEAAPFCVLGDTRRYPEALGEALQIAVSRARLADMPRTVSGFCRDFDLQLVQILRPEPGAYRFVLAWSDDIGRPRFIAVELCADYYADGRLLLRSEELLGRRRLALDEGGLAKGFEVPAADIQFAQHLLNRLREGELSEQDGEFLGRLWLEDATGVMETISRFWPAREDTRRIAQAARQNDWAPVHDDVGRLQRALRRRRVVGAFAVRAAGLVRRAFHPQGALVAFIGGEDSGRSSVLQHVLRDLGPVFSGRLRTVESSQPVRGWGVRPDLYILFDVPRPLAGGLESRMDETVHVDTARPLPAVTAHVERAILQWLERRVERRYPRACVGDNPPAARVLQWATRTRLPVVARLVNWALGCDIRCRVRWPILMPHPSGIFIHRDARIGRRVTLMHQVTIGWRHRSDRRTPVIEDNVFIGAGAKILGAVCIGRGASIGANAVVTRDVPSHCTVVGANRILGQGEAVVAGGRRKEPGVVVNM
jgi:serine O-acetyltransferase